MHAAARHLSSDHDAVLSGRATLFEKARTQCRALFQDAGRRHCGAGLDRRGGDALGRGAPRSSEDRYRSERAVQSADRWNPRFGVLCECRVAAALGYDVALVRTPHFYRPQMQPANLLAFYRTVADRSPIPILIYSVPVFTNYDMPAELIIHLADHPNIIGIKESGGDVEKIRLVAERTRHVKCSATVTETFAAVTPRMLRAAEAVSSNRGGELVPVGVLNGSTAHRAQSSTTDRTGSTDQVRTGAPARSAERSSAHPSSPGITVLGNLKTRQKEVGFQILAGSAQRLHPSLEAGAVGGVLAFADPAPTACYEIYTAWKEGDAERARLKQDRISAAATRVASNLGISAIKYALDLNGYYGGPARLPLLPLTADLKGEVEQLMADIRN